MPMKRISQIFFVVIIFLSVGAVSAIEECLREQDQDKIPCLLVTAFPPDGACNTHNLSTFDSNGSLLSKQIMATIGDSGRCDGNFTFTTLGQYYANATTLDSWNVQVVEGNMNFFNLLIYITFSAIVFVLIVFMHKFRDSSGSSIVYGWLATAISLILGAILVTPGFEVLKGISLFFPIDTYLGFLSFMIGAYTALFSMNLFKQTRPQEEGA